MNSTAVNGTAGSSSNMSAPLNGSAASGSGKNESVLDIVLKDRTAEGGAVNKTKSTVVGDMCTWYATQECVKARTCFDCLNTFIDGRVCMIDQYGMCVTMANYDPSLDFRRPLPSNVQQISPNHFPSTNTTYCAADDQYCGICREAWDNPFKNSELAYINICRGVGGCVCTRTCESSYRNENIIAQRCQIIYQRPSAKMIYTSVAIMAALCLVFAIVTMFARRWVTRFDVRGRRHEQPLPQRQPTGPRLALSGWRSMRQKLIETEHEQLRGTDNQTLTAPMIDNTVGPAVVVEQGDGFLPASPSDLARQRQRQLSQSASHANEPPVAAHRSTTEL